MARMEFGCSQCCSNSHILRRTHTLVDVMASYTDILNELVIDSRHLSPSSRPGYVALKMQMLCPGNYEVEMAWDCDYLGNDTSSVKLKFHDQEEKVEWMLKWS